MDLQPVPNIPALRADEYLVISDLHIGVESHLRTKGFHIVSHTEEMLDSILKAAGNICSKLIVTGDVKDSVPGSNKQEYKEIPMFFDTLLEHFDSVDLVRGNHDTNIEEFLSGRVNIRPATGLRIMDTGFVHGHTWPSEHVMSAETLVMGHDHPSIMFRDGIGRQSSEPCWVKGDFKESIQDNRFKTIPKHFIIVPAFNRMLGGSPVNISDEPLLGPILNSNMLDIDNSEIYLLDGIYLGKRLDLMIDGRNPTLRKTYNMKNNV